MEISDEEVDRIFEEIAARFGKEEKNEAAGAVTQTHRSANGGLVRRRRFHMTAERRREAREKFMLVAIVARARLPKADRAFLLGGLLELATIVPGSAEHRRLRDIGGEAFKAPLLASISPPIGGKAG